MIYLFLLLRKNMGINTISSALNAHAGNMNGNGNGNVSFLLFIFYLISCSSFVVWALIFLLCFCELNKQSVGEFSLEFHDCLSRDTYFGIAFYDCFIFFLISCVYVLNNCFLFHIND